MQTCPDELLKNQRFAFIKGHPKLLGTPYKFSQHGKSGAWISELLPNIAGISDEMAIIKSMRTDEFNHSPAELFLHTGRPFNRHRRILGHVRLGLRESDLPG
jgi:hypothetical protein